METVDEEFLKATLDFIDRQGVVMAILSFLAAASPFLTSGFVGLAALFTARNVPGIVRTLLNAVLAILTGAFPAEACPCSKPRC